MSDVEEATPSGDEAVAQQPETRTPGWVRTVIFGGTALILLLVGATVGLLIGRSELIDDSSAAASPGAVDIGFSQDMSVHHLQAVRMGNIARENSKDPEIRQLAFDIASTQQGQVGSMHGWLTLWEAPHQATGELMSWMPDEHHGGQDTGEQPDVAMPGMAGSEEMAELNELKGKEHDVLFLQLMLRHHQGGVPMAEYAAEHADIPAVRALAQSMVNSQGAEMDTMRGMLAERGAEPLPFG